MKVGTKGLVEGYKPHLLDAAEMLTVAWKEVDHESFARYTFVLFVSFVLCCVHVDVDVFRLIL